MKKLIIAICAVIVGIVGCTAYFISGAKPKEPKPVDYTVYVYPDGHAQINVDSINKIIQTREDIMAGNMELKAGTIILPGNGNPVYYDYPRKDTVIIEGE
uniref:Uncharacterized protein n=1 Tax=Siphoviridae sp. ctnNB1 TaxID=2825660 RepID=A0A8S5UVG5_9CAUD|nr:MAG TPA: hypothetical protein [Siphoviridae sp. ctnNB1]